jgi:hypothetical protein
MHRAAVAENHECRCGAQIGPSQCHDDRVAPGTTPGTTPVIAPADTMLTEGRRYDRARATAGSSASAPTSEPMGVPMLIDRPDRSAATPEHPRRRSAPALPRTRTENPSARQRPPALDRTPRPAELSPSTMRNSAVDPLERDKQSRRNCSHRCIGDAGHGVGRQRRVSRDPTHRTRWTRARSR